jgi:hypothetical protein
VKDGLTLTRESRFGGSWLVERGAEVLGMVFRESVMGKRTGLWEWRTIGGNAGVAADRNAAVADLVRTRDQGHLFWQTFADCLREATR